LSEWRYINVKTLFVGLLGLGLGFASKIAVKFVAAQQQGSLSLSEDDLLLLYGIGTAVLIILLSLHRGGGQP
jgi:hypothetical protein